MVEEQGDKMPISWLHRSERYGEKLATPDVSVADLIGDIDPVKAANLKLDFSDERVIHYGIIPRSNRCIFVINELPDLQARIQVSLFNILQISRSVDSSCACHWTLFLYSLPIRRIIPTEDQL
jgi:magnesium chelatase subunit I